MSRTDERIEIEPGKLIYDDDGNELGTVRGFDDQGFYVVAKDNVKVLDEGTASSDHRDAIMWRCWECGEMGQIEDIPEECPACGAPKEDIYYWQED
jgi:hypothetical protein